jgi:predicted transcriptional regulator
MNTEQTTEDTDAPGRGMTPEAFEQALSELGWKSVDFTRKAGIVPNTAWRWRKGHAPIPMWVGEYLGAMLEIQRLHARFVAVTKARDQAEA